MWMPGGKAVIYLYHLNKENPPCGDNIDKLTGLQFVNNGDKVDALYFSTFHGGSDATWAPTTDSYTWFDDIIISTKLSDVVKTTVTSVKDHRMVDLENVVSSLSLSSDEEVFLPIS